VAERSYDDLPEAPVRVALSVPLSVPLAPVITSVPAPAAVPAAVAGTAPPRGRHRAPAVSTAPQHGVRDTLRVGVIAAAAVFLALTVFLVVSNTWLG